MENSNSDSNHYEYLNLRPDELKAAIDKVPVAYISLGALEWHGPHLALGLDSIKAEYIVRQAWNQTGGVIFPPVNWHSIQTMPFPYTFQYPNKHLRTYVKNSLKALNEMGFKVIVMLSGHYPSGLVKILRKASIKNNRKRKSILIGFHEPMLALDKNYLGDHAAFWETSILMAIDENLVDLNRLYPETIPSFERVEKYGIMGKDPIIHASKEAGQSILQHIIISLVNLVKTNLEKPDSESIKKLFNQYDSFFKHPFELGIKEMDCENLNELIKITWWQFKKTGRLF